MSDTLRQWWTGVTDTEAWTWLAGTGLLILITLVGGIGLRWLIHRTIDRVVRSTIERNRQRLEDKPARNQGESVGVAAERYRQRTTTMGALLKSITTFVVAAVVIITMMDIVGIPVGPLLASAGVGGVALAFGAQSLVKDFLSGLFMIIEDQYGVGDVIDTGEAIGTVEDVTLRITRLRDGGGVIWYIRNGEIVRIGNRSQGWSVAVVDVQVAYDEDIDKAIDLMRDVVRRMDAEEEWQDRLLEKPEVVGVESITPGAVTVRITAKCAANENFPVNREIRERVKQAMDKAGVRGPAPAPPYAQQP